MEFVKDSVFYQKFPFESSLIDIKKYFSDYSQLLTSFENCQNDKCKNNEEPGCEESDCKNDDFYAEFLKISKEQLKELKERTSVDNLTCDGEIEPKPLDFYKRFNEEKIKPVLDGDEDEDETPQSKLLSVRNQAEITNVFKSALPRNFFKYCNYQWCPNNDRQTRNKLDFSSQDSSNVVACVKVYYPFLSRRCKTTKIKLLQEIHILGNQSLAELRDKIVCTLDHVGSKDASSECFLKEVGLNLTDKDEYPSSFIFIENTFYNDTRSPDMVDLSKEIREWGSSRGLGPFECGSMEATRICDLKLKVGRPYVFQHQGNCEHLIVFSDVRFLELSDPSKATSYPRIHCTGRIYGKHCMMCADSFARWLVVNSDRLTHDKTYLCKKCFLSYHYVDGHKIGEFEAFRYVDPIAIL